MTREGDPLWSAVAKRLDESLLDSDHETQATLCKTIWQEEILPDTQKLRFFRTVLSREQLASQLVLEEWFKFQSRFKGFKENSDRAIADVIAGSKGELLTTSYGLHLARLFVMEFSLKHS